MDGYVTDFISCFTAETGRQPTYEEYSQIMTGFTPEQIPVLSGLARGFGVFDHWFCEVPSQTLPNRSFWTAATSSGFSVNAPVKNFVPPISRPMPRTATCPTSRSSSLRWAWVTTTTTRPAGGPWDMAWRSPAWTRHRRSWAARRS